MKTVCLLSLLFVACSGIIIKNGEVQDWWETSILYQIYPRSFADSDGDGIGDLNGITSKLEYIKELGVGAVWLSPIFKSPMVDFGYDIANFYEIHHEYGTMEDFEALLKKANELDIKVVLDLVPNHTSNESVWFQEALNGNEKYYNYFVWEDGIIDENGNRQPPNNWLSHFRGSAWEYKEEVGKYYLHQFAVGQPDLNYRNQDVVDEMKVGNHDNSRMATRYGASLVDGINMLVLLLPGVAVTYMGEEIGLEDGYVSWEDTVDPSGCNTNDPIKYVESSRDPERTPFHWNPEKNAGFSTADKTWLPMAEGYETLNVEVQKASERSHLKVYKALSDLRQENTFRYGRYESLALNQDIFVFKRWLNDVIYLVVVNMRDVEHNIDLTYFENVSGNVAVSIRSVNSPKNEGDTFDAKSLPVVGFEGLVLKVV